MGSSELSWWLAQAGRYPLLSPQQELTLGRLIQRWQTDPNPSPVVEKRGRRARDRMVAANLRLAVVIAKRYQQHVSSAMGFADLIQGANLGLIRAAEKFDPARGYKFSTYAYWWASQGVASVIDRESRTIRMPTTFAPRLQQMGRATQQLVGQLGREPTRDELAQALGMKREDLDAVLAVGSRCTSLDRLLGGDSDSTFLDGLAAPEPESDHHLQELRERLALLPHTLARLVIDAYGLDGPRVPRRRLAQQEGCTAAELAGRLKLALRMLGVDDGHRPPPAAAPGPPVAFSEQLTLLPPEVAAPGPYARARAQKRAGRRAGRRPSPVQQLCALLV